MPSFKRVAVIGSAGQLGSDIVRVLAASSGYEVTPLTHDQVNVTDRTAVMAVLGRDPFTVVVNCAAFHRVDECEDRPDEAFRVNALGALEVARACWATGSVCVFISTDFIFGGAKKSPYTEADQPDPINVYGASKVAGEFLVRQTAPSHLILRVASLYGKVGPRGKGSNFVETILARARAGEAIRVVDDITMSPTYTYDVACLLHALLEASATGVYHATNSGYCTWLEYASEALRLVSSSALVEPITSNAYPSKARRPKNSSLKSLGIEQMLGRPMRPWQQALQAYLVEKGHLAATGAVGPY